MSRAALIGWGAALVLLASLAWALSHQRSQLADARRDAEAARLQLKSQIVQQEDSSKALGLTVKGLLAQNDELRAAVQEAQAAAPQARVVRVEVLATKPLPVEASPRLVALPAGPAKPVEPLDDLMMPATVCVLAKDDTGSIQINEVQLQTRDGNTLVAGTAAAYRESPDRAVLFTGRFVSRLSDVSGLAPPPEPRWGAMLLGSCDVTGCAPGVGVLPPPLPLFGKRLESVLAAFPGPSRPRLEAGVGLRF